MACPGVSLRGPRNGVRTRRDFEGRITRPMDACWRVIARESRGTLIHGYAWGSPASSWMHVRATTDAIESLLSPAAYASLVQMQSAIVPTGEER